MREIKFRALKDDISNCNFVYGQLVYDAIGQPRITEVDSSKQGLTFHTCIKGTESQYTGLNDKNGIEIYEGSNVSFTVIDACKQGCESTSKGTISWDIDDTGFYIDNIDDKFPHVKLWFAENIKVIA